MEPTQFANGHIQSHGAAEHDHLSAISGSEYDGSVSFQILDDTGDQELPPTGIRDEILLLSWLIVILRTQDSGQISYEWAYGIQATDTEAQPVVRRLLMKDVVVDLKEEIRNAAEATARHVMDVSQREHTTTIPISLLLSTGSLSRTEEGGQEKVSGRSSLDF
jgi:hypothetical protein